LLADCTEELFEKLNKDKTVVLIIDTYNKHANNIEVTGSHLGLGVNPQVWKVIARTLHNA
jgi:hypothetical protein